MSFSRRDTWQIQKASDVKNALFVLVNMASLAKFFLEVAAPGRPRR